MKNQILLLLSFSGCVNHVISQFEFDQFNNPLFFPQHPLHQTQFRLTPLHGGFPGLPEPIQQLAGNPFLFAGRLGDGLPLPGDPINFLTPPQFHGIQTPIQTLEPSPKVQLEPAEPTQPQSKPPPKVDEVDDADAQDADGPVVASAVVFTDDGEPTVIVPPSPNLERRASKQSRPSVSTGQCTLDNEIWEVFPQRVMSQATMFHRTTGNSCEECELECSRHQNRDKPWVCRAITYDHKWMICDIYAVTHTTVGFPLAPFDGRDYFWLKDTDLLLQRAGRSSVIEGGDTRRTTLVTRHIPRDKSHSIVTPRLQKILSSIDGFPPIHSLPSPPPIPAIEDFFPANIQKVEEFEEAPAPPSIRPVPPVISVDITTPTPTTEATTETTTPLSTTTAPPPPTTTTKLTFEYEDYPTMPLDHVSDDVDVTKLDAFDGNMDDLDPVSMIEFGADASVPNQKQSTSIERLIDETLGDIEHIEGLLNENDLIDVRAVSDEHVVIGEQKQSDEHKHEHEHVDEQEQEQGRGPASLPMVPVQWPECTEPNTRGVYCRMEHYAPLNFKVSHLFHNATELDCALACSESQGMFTAPCRMYIYHEGECVLSDERVQWTVDVPDPFLREDETTFASKYCFEESLVADRNKFWYVAPNKVLLGAVREVVTAGSLVDCKKLCLSTTQFRCRSGVWYPQLEMNTCLLSSETRHTIPRNFVTEDEERHVFYFDFGE